MSTDALAARLARLERAHRRLQRLLVAFLAVLSGGLLIAACGDGVLTGHTLKLLDDQGRLRLLATVNSGLSIFDEAGRPRAILGNDGQGDPGLVLNGDASGVALNVNRDGPALALTAERGSLRAVLALMKGQPGLVFYDAEEHERLSLGVIDGRGRGVLHDAAGAVAWSVPTED
jgi:hypothetical protein